MKFNFNSPAPFNPREARSADQNIMSAAEVDKEIRNASLEGRDINLKYKTIALISLEGKTIEDNLNLEGAIVLGSVSVSNCTIKGEVNLTSATINGSLYLAGSIFKGDVKLEKAVVKGVINLSASRIFGSLLARGMSSSGFLNLTSTEIKCDADLSNIKTSDAYYAGLIIQGDVYFRNAVIGSHLTLENAFIDGTLDMLGAYVAGDANFNNCVIEEFFVIKDFKAKGVTKMEEMQYKEKITR